MEILIGKEFSILSYSHPFGGGIILNNIILLLLYGNKRDKTNKIERNS